jgi:hypothetical protein
MTSAQWNIPGSILLAVAISSCTSGPRRADLIASLRASYAPVHEMEIVVSAGVTLNEYSPRVTDELLKFKSTEDSCKEVAVNLSDASLKSQAAQVCQHLSTAMDAYVVAKDYFGDTHETDLDPFEPGKNNVVDGSTYEDLHARFPSIQASPSNGVAESPSSTYWRGDVLQALWKVATQEGQTAKEMIDKLAQSEK